MTTIDRRQAIDDFEAHYAYDSTYMREMLEHVPEAYDKFDAFMPLASHRLALPLEDYWLARIGAMQAEDCGHCLQLNVRMAREAGVPRAILLAALRETTALAPALADARAYGYAVAANEGPPEQHLSVRIRARYDQPQLLELAICIAAVRVFPAIKRALGYTRSCQLIDVEV